MTWRKKTENIPWLWIIAGLVALAKSNGIISDREIVNFFRLIVWIILLVLAILIFKWIKSERTHTRSIATKADESIEEILEAKKIYDLYESNPELLNNKDFLDKFHRHWGWRRIKTAFIDEKRSKTGLFCAACGKTSKFRIHVDHIKPKSKYPELRYLKTNLQILCEKCNIHKSDYDGDDWINVIKERKVSFQQKKRKQNAKKQP